MRNLFKKFARRSLTVKLVLTVSFVFCLIIGVGTLAMVYASKKAIAETSVATALYQTQLLKTKLLESMVDENERHEELNALLKDSRSIGRMDEVNIFDAAGTIKFSSVPQNIGKTVEAAFGPSERFTMDDAMVQFANNPKTDRLRIVHPVHGGRQCAACHQARDGMVGGIELFVPLQPIYRQFSRSRIYFLVLASLIVLSGAFLIRWFVDRIVKQPIKNLIGVMEKAKGGELGVRTRVHADPDLQRLARSFNAMVHGIKAAQDDVDRQHRKELSQSNRLASLGQLISNVSHEIKNPLAAMSSALHALRDGFQAAEEQEIFRELTRQIGRIEQTVNNLLRYARQAPPKFEQFRAETLASGPLDQALQLASHRFRENGIQVRIRCESPLICIWADSGQLQQVFLNLFLNAASAMPSGGTLQILLRREDAAESGEGPDPAGENLVVEVSDTGIGIRSENLSRVFEPFFTTTDGGSGLGLSVVKGIVEAHNGSIRVESPAGQGTKVILCFPAAGSAEPLAAAVRKTEAGS